MTADPDEPSGNVPPALDAALGRSLAVPALPAGFRSQVHAAIQATQQDAGEQRELLEAERRIRLAQLKAEYRWQRLRALLDFAGAAIVAAAIFAVAWPMVPASIGSELLREMPLLATLAALAVAAAVTLRRMGFGNPLEQI